MFRTLDELRSLEIGRDSLGLLTYIVVHGLAGELRINLRWAGALYYCLLDGQDIGRCQSHKNLDLFLILLAVPELTEESFPKIDFTGCRVSGNLIRVLLEALRY